MRCEYERNKGSVGECVLSENYVSISKAIGLKGFFQAT